MTIDQTLADAVYGDPFIAEDVTWIPAGGPPQTVRGIFDMGLQTTVREETRDDVYNTVLELKVRQSEIAADVIKKGDSFLIQSAGGGITYTVRSHDVLNTTELAIKLTQAT
jgi:hypothetical protein